MISKRSPKDFNPEDMKKRIRAMFGLVDGIGLEFRERLGLSETPQRQKMGKRIKTRKEGQAPQEDNPSTEPQPTQQQGFQRPRILGNFFSRFMGPQEPELTPEQIAEQERLQQEELYHQEQEEKRRQDEILSTRKKSNPLG